MLFSRTERYVDNCHLICVFIRSILIVEIGWPRPEVLTVVGFFVTPGMAVLYKDVREFIIPRVYRWVFRRQRVQEDEEDPAANGVLPVQNNELPAWGDIEAELFAGVEQWMD